MVSTATLITVALVLTLLLSLGAIVVALVEGTTLIFWVFLILAFVSLVTGAGLWLHKLSKKRAKIG